MDLPKDLELTIESIQRGNDPDPVQKALIEALLGDTIHPPTPPAPADLHRPPPGSPAGFTDPWMEFHRPSPLDQCFDLERVSFSSPVDLFDDQPTSSSSPTTFDLETISELAANDLLLYKKSQPSPPSLNDLADLWIDLCPQPLPSVGPPSSVVAEPLDPYPPPPPLPPKVDDPTDNGHRRSSPLPPTPPHTPATLPGKFKASPSESLPPPLPSPTVAVADARLDPKPSPPPSYAAPVVVGYLQPPTPLPHTAPVGTLYLQPQAPTLLTPIAQADSCMGYYHPLLLPPPSPATALAQVELAEVPYLQPPTTIALSDPCIGLHPPPLAPSSVVPQSCYLQSSPCSYVTPTVQTNQWLLPPQFVNTPTVMLPANTIPVGISNGELVYSSPPKITAPLSVNLIASLKRKYTKKQDDDGKPYIKKPPNAFLIFMKEERPSVVAELQSRNNAVVNTVLGERWASLPQQEKHRYFLEADKLRVLHEQQYPDWSPRDNYGKKRKRYRRSSCGQSQATGQDVYTS